MVVKKREEGVVSLRDGVRKQNLVNGKKTQMVKFFLEKDKSMPVHAHRHEQTGYLISGKMILSINDEEHTVEAGDSWCIWGNTPHSARMLEDCVVVEVFSPVRKDYMD